MAKKGSLLGMPAARPFDLETDRDNAERTPLFVVRYNTLHLSYDEMIACGLRRDYSFFEDREVLGFTHAEMETLLQRSGLTMTRRRGSTQPNVEWVTLEREELRFPDDVDSLLPKEAMLQYPFEVGEFRGYSKSQFSYLVSRMLGLVVKREILLDASGYQRAYKPHGAFQVYVYSTPESGRRDYAPRQIWGYTVYDRDAFIPYGVRADAGVLIEDGDYAVAELFPNALYIHHAAMQEGTDAEFRIIARLLQEVAKHLGDPEGFAEELRKVHAAFFEAQQKMFESIVQKSIPKRTQRINVQLKRAREDVARLRKEYFEAQRTFFGLENAVLEPEVVAKRFREELEKLQQGKVACVEKVVLTGDGDTNLSELEVYTTELTARYPRKDTEYLLGRYRIVLRLGYDVDNNEAGGGLIKMFNLDRDPGGYHHPHVNTDGNPCLGNLEDELPEYVAHFEIEAAITLAIAFLQTLTLEDVGYISIENWPIVSPKDEKENS